MKNEVTVTLTSASVAAVFQHMVQLPLRTSTGPNLEFLLRVIITESAPLRQTPSILCVLMY